MEAPPEEGTGSSAREQYEEIIINCLRYLGMNDLTEIEKMTLYEYDLRIHAWELKQIDEDRDIHLTAWQIKEAQAKKKKGKKKLEYVYKTFEDFFDYAGRINCAKGKKPAEKPLTPGQRAMEYKRRKQDGRL